MTKMIVRELDSFNVRDDDAEESVSIRVFELSLDGVNVRVCSLGASITQFVVPRKDGALGMQDQYDDLVLGYATPRDQWTSKNPVYFTSVVGRVANRIAKGHLQVEDNGEVRQLAVNNPPNHLHGGPKGFSHCNWEEAEILHDEEAASRGPAVRFSRISRDGEENYPGNLKVSATYSLQDSTTDSGARSIRLSLRLEATLIPASASSSDVCTPVNLAQHTYWNLSRHDDPQGILQHRLTLPSSSAYTPVDSTGIPTRQVTYFDHHSDGNDHSASSPPQVMDWRQEKQVGQALIDYGMQMCHLTPDEARAEVEENRCTKYSVDPFGFDHNYVLSTPPARAEPTPSFQVAGILEHPATKRRLTVRTTAPGVQLYTANYLDGTVPSVTSKDGIHMKDGATYHRWQGLCLETQHFPDSVCVSNDPKYEAFAKGKCVILSSNSPHYQQDVEYQLEY